MEAAAERRRERRRWEVAVKAEKRSPRRSGSRSARGSQSSPKRKSKSGRRSKSPRGRRSRSPHHGAVRVKQVNGVGSGGARPCELPAARLCP
uniref:Uncharacterized protein n=1 Tax=Pavo cristatus TaxID=9049 RepID=A0A8C9L5P3_PAVCR